MDRTNTGRKKAGKQSKWVLFKKMHEIEEDQKVGPFN